MSLAQDANSRKLPDTETW